MFESLRRKVLEGAGNLLSGGHEAINEALDAGQKALDREAKVARVREIACEVGMKVLASREKVSLPAEVAALAEEGRALLVEIQK